MAQYGEREHAISCKPDHKNQQEHDWHEVCFRSIFIRRVLFFRVCLLFDARVMCGRSDAESVLEDVRDGRRGP